MPRLVTSCLVLAVLLSSACSPMLQVEPAEPVAPAAPLLGVEQPDRYWWQLAFKLAWPGDEEPDLSRHLLIAEQLLAPAIVEYQGGMPLWRFHRRAARTPPGNQFSLVFYTDEATAVQLGESVTAHPLTDWLEDNGMLETVRLDRRSPAELGRLEHSSDENWPMEIQRSWPYFIMGVSQAWLTLVQELSQETALSGRVDYPELLAHYRDVDQRLNQQWWEHGQHAYLHHLNAVFGYHPLQIRTNGMLTF